MKKLTRYKLIGSAATLGLMAPGGYWLDQHNKTVITELVNQVSGAVQPYLECSSQPGPITVEKQPKHLTFSYTDSDHNTTYLRVHHDGQQTAWFDFHPPEGLSFTPRKITQEILQTQVLDGFIARANIALIAGPRLKVWPHPDIWQCE